MEQPEYQSPENDDYGEDDVASYDGDLPDADQSATDDVTEDPQSQVRFSFSSFFFSC